MKIVKFFAEPNLLITDAETGKPLFSFDENGEYMTMDPNLIKRLSTYHRSEEIEIKSENNVPNEEIKKFHCEKCNFSTDNRGELMAHYKTHKEG